MSTQHRTRPTPGTVTRGVLSIALGLLMAALVAAPAAAHAELASADPADASTVTGTPALITLTFTDGLTDRSFFNLKYADGTIAGKGAVDPGDEKALVLVPPSLAAGAYTIEWQAATADGHIEKGVTTFTVVVPAATAIATDDPTTAPTLTPSLAPTATPVATPIDESPAGSATDVVIPIAAGLLLVATLAFLMVRRGRSA